jgi:hypothetical protein
MSAGYALRRKGAARTRGRNCSVVSGGGVGAGAGFLRHFPAAEYAERVGKRPAPFSQRPGGPTLWANVLTLDRKRGPPFLTEHRKLLLGAAIPLARPGRPRPPFGSISRMITSFIMRKTSRIPSRRG